MVARSFPTNPATIAQLLATTIAPTAWTITRPSLGQQKEGSIGRSATQAVFLKFDTAPAAVLQRLSDLGVTPPRVRAGNSTVARMSFRTVWTARTPRRGAGLGSICRSSPNAPGGIKPTPLCTPCSQPKPRRAPITTTWLPRLPRLSTLSPACAFSPRSPPTSLPPCPS